MIGWLWKLKEWEVCVTGATGCLVLVLPSFPGGHSPRGPT